MVNVIYYFVGLLGSLTILLLFFSFGIDLSALIGVKLASPVSLRLDLVVICAAVFFDVLGDLSFLRLFFSLGCLHFLFELFIFHLIKDLVVGVNYAEVAEFALDEVHERFVVLEQLGSRFVV